MEGIAKDHSTPGWSRLDKELLQLSHTGSGGHNERGKAVGKTGSGSKSAFVSPVVGGRHQRIKKVKNPWSPSTATPFISAAVQPMVSLKKGPPTASWVALERAQLDGLLSNSLWMCRKCHSGLSFSYSHIGVATTPTLQCTGKCGASVTVPPAKATVQLGNRTGHVHLSDAALNVLCVIGFLSCGDGGTEAQ